MSEARRGLAVRLFSYGQLESKDETEERLERCHRDLGAQTTNIRENEVYNHLSEKVSHSGQQHEEVTLALLYSILTDPNLASKSYHTLLLITRDGMNLVVNMVEKIIMEKMTKLQETTRLQLMWLVREVVGSAVAGADRICFALLKHLPVGCTSTSDIYIADSLLNILLDHREWLEGMPALVDSAVFSYLAVLPSHSAQSLTSLRQQETDFCISLLRTKFTDVMSIGRDLLRLLQGVARIPEFTELWRDLLQQPQSLCPQLTDIHQLLIKRTSRRFVAGRVLPEVEIKLNFLLSKVKFGQHKRYQEWFQKKYLSTPESLLQIPELVRFVCCVIHPPNEILQSDIVPRWALVGWLLSLCQGSPVVLASAKLALFYDWLAYKPELDNIMNIEPGILLMTHSLKQHPQLSAMLMEFLCKLIASFCPSLEQRLREGVLAAFNDILNKEVILSVEPLFESSRFDDALKQLIRNTFPEFYPQAPIPQPAEHQPVSELHPPSISPPPSSTSDVVVTSPRRRVGEWVGGSVDVPVVIVDEPEEEDVQGEDQEIMGAFSDCEEEKVGERGGSQLGLVAVGSSPQHGEEGEEGLGEMEEEGEDRLSELPDNIRENLVSLCNESDGVIQLTLLDDLLQMIDDKSTEVSGNQMMSVVGEVVARALAEDFSTGFRPEDSSEQEQDAEVSERPTTFLCRRGSEGGVALSLLVSVSQHQTSTGYFFLMYLLHNACGQLPQYKDFATQFSPDKGLQCVLVADLTVCVENESNLFYDTLPLLYKEFAVELKQCDELLALIVAHIDPTQLHSIMQKLMVRDFFIFGKEKACIEHLITKSLQLDSFEQFCVWQLLSAEGPDCSLVIPTIGKLDTEEHHEALSGAILFLRAESSGVMGVWELLSMPAQHSDLVEAVGSRWINAKPSKYAKYIAHFVDKCEKEILPISLAHLQNITKHLNGNHLFEAADGTVTKTLSKLFSSSADYQEKFEKIFQIVSSITDPPEKKVEAGVKRTLPGKSEAKHKKRRVINIDELTDS